MLELVGLVWDHRQEEIPSSRSPKMDGEPHKPIQPQNTAKGFEARQEAGKWTLLGLKLILAALALSLCRDLILGGALILSGETRGLTIFEGLWPVTLLASLLIFGGAFLMFKGRREFSFRHEGLAKVSFAFYGAYLAMVFHRYLTLLSSGPSAYYSSYEQFLTIFILLSLLVMVSLVTRVYHLLEAQGRMALWILIIIWIIPFALLSNIIILRFNISGVENGAFWISIYDGWITGALALFVYWSAVRSITGGRIPFRHEMEQAGAGNMADEKLTDPFSEAGPPPPSKPDPLRYGELVDEELDSSYG